MTINTVFDIFNPEGDTPAVIEAKAIAFANNMVTVTEEINATTQAMNFNATNSTSTTSWTVANTGSKTFTIEAGKSYVPGMTVKVASTASGPNWGLGDVTAASSGSITVAFRVKNGSGTFSAWTISQNAEISTLRTAREARTANTIISTSDVGKLIDITSGTFTQTFSAAATLGNGFFVTIRNNGTGDITLDPSGSETIDGRTSFIMFPGEVREILCDGSALYSLVIKPFFRRITSTYASMPIPPGYTCFGMRLWSGGASGQRTNNTGTLSVGGGGGGCLDVSLPSSNFSTTETVTIGAGGAAVTTVANGNVGGDTTFGSLAAAYAGDNFARGGSAIDGLNESASLEATYAGGGSNTLTITTIWGGGSPSSNASFNGAPSLYGGGSGGCLNASATLRSAGTSVFGGDGGAAVSAGNGTSGTQPGGGGGATQTGTQSGAGAAGEVWFWGLV